MIGIGARIINKQVNIENKKYSLELFQLIIQHEHPNLEKERQLVDWCRQAITEVDRSSQRDYGMDLIDLIKQSNIRISTEEISQVKVKHAYECTDGRPPQLTATIRLSSVNKLVLTTAINHIRSRYDFSADMLKLLYQKYNPNLSINIQAKPQIEILDQSDNYQRLPSISSILNSLQENTIPVHSSHDMRDDSLNDVASTLLILSKNENSKLREQAVGVNPQLPRFPSLLSNVIQAQKSGDLEGNGQENIRLPSFKKFAF
jgi:hypothetical protein